jgi:hypothetical protein
MRLLTEKLKEITVLTMTVVEAIIPERTLGRVLNALSGYSLPLSLSAELVKLEHRPTVDYNCLANLSRLMTGLTVSDDQIARCISGGGSYDIEVFRNFYSILIPGITPRSVFNWKEDLLFLKEQRLIYATKNVVLTIFALYCLKVVIKKTIKTIKNIIKNI